MANLYAVTINGIDRTKDILGQTMHVEDVLNDRQSTCYFMLMDRFGLGFPDNEQEVIITDQAGNRIFGGVIVKLDFQSQGASGFGMPVAQVTCQDYIRLLDKILVNQVYINETDQDIILDIINNICSGSGIVGNVANIGNAATISQIKFNYQQPSQALRKITDNTGYNWYIDYYKNLFYFPNSQNAAPFNIDTSTDDKVQALTLTQDNSQLRNRVYVRGATRQSDPYSFITHGDGVMTQFVLPTKPHDKSSVTVKVNGTTKTVGTFNVDTSGYDWYVDTTNGFVQQDSGGTVLTSSDTLEVDYVYDVPILVVVENSASISEFGAHEYEINDKTITTNQAAIDRAQAELNDYGGTLNEGTFTTYTPGLRSGQIITITDAAYDISSVDYLIQKVVATPIGGGYFKYDVTLASAKTMGIIRFLVEMLETQQNQVDISDNEVLDNLKTLDDTVSETDSLSSSSASPTANWGSVDWDLFQWN